MDLVCNDNTEAAMSAMENLHSPAIALNIIGVNGARACFRRRCFLQQGCRGSFLLLTDLVSEPQASRPSLDKGRIIQMWVVD
ncbi:MAG TPA: hypothetical protein VN950_26715 [Terriglobales bacterium]|nr:hypothetical protein [Terriglobales bacterium]